MLSHVSPLWIEQCTSFVKKKKNEFPFPTMLCAKFGWNQQSGSGEEDENVKSLQTDKGQMGIRKSHKLSAQVNKLEYPL